MNRLMCAMLLAVTLNFAISPAMAQMKTAPKHPVSAQKISVLRVTSVIPSKIEIGQGEKVVVKISGSGLERPGLMAVALRNGRPEPGLKCVMARTGDGNSRKIDILAASTVKPGLLSMRVEAGVEKVDVPLLITVTSMAREAAPPLAAKPQTQTKQNTGKETSQALPSTPNTSSGSINLQLKSAIPARVTLTPGGDSVSVRLVGTGLDQANLKGRIFRNNRLEPAVKTELLQSRDPHSRTVDITAGARTIPGTLTLQLFNVRDKADVPLVITVISGPTDLPPTRGVEPSPFKTIGTAPQINTQAATAKTQDTGKSASVGGVQKTEITDQSPGRQPLGLAGKELPPTQGVEPSPFKAIEAASQFQVQTGIKKTEGPSGPTVANDLQKPVAAASAQGLQLSGLTANQAKVDIPCGLESNTPSTDLNTMQVANDTTAEAPGLSGQTAGVRKLKGTELSVGKPIGTIGETIDLWATLKTDAGERAPHQTVFFWVDGVMAGSAKTGTDGVARIAYTMPDSPGAKPILARYSGSNICLPATGTETLGTLKSPTEIVIADPWGNYSPSPQSETRNYRPTLSLAFDAILRRTSDHKGIEGRQIDFSTDGVPTDLIATKKAGHFWYQIPEEVLSTPGVHQFQARFEEDSLYLGTTAAKILSIIVPQPAVLEYRSGSVTYGQAVSIPVVLKKKYAWYNAEIPGKTVILTMVTADSTPAIITKGEGVTDSAGYALISLDMESSRFNCPCRIYWDSKDLGPEYVVDEDQIPIYFEIRKTGVNLLVTSPGEGVIIGEPLTFRVKVTRAMDGKPLKSIRVSTPGLNTATTNADGWATLEGVAPTDTLGPRVFQITAQESRFYLAGVGSATVTLKPRTD